MTANSEQFKMKKSHYPYKFFIFSLHSRFTLMIFLKIGHLLPNFLEFLFPIFKKSEVIETMCIQLKTYVTKFCSFCVFLLKHFDVFWMFLLLFANFSGAFLWRFSLIFMTMHKEGNRFYPTTKNNKLMETI